ncbi:MAG: ABC transporter ATP-binding protein [Candidatus Competibacteraceae bacterium]
MSVIQTEAVGFAYQAHWVLQDIRFQVEAGEIFGLVGADGAGKTTLLRLAVGQVSPGHGRILVLGQPADSPSLRAEVAYMPQGFGLYQDLSVQENVNFFADLHGLPPTVARELIADLLQRTGLCGFETRRAGQLSGGMMQKLALACALLSQPKVMILDEPTTGVDPVSRRAFWRLLDGVRREGVAILYATANMDEAERCDRVGLLSKGRLERQGTPLELASSSTAHLVEVSGPQVRRRRALLEIWPEMEWVFPIGRQLRVWLKPPATLADLQARLAVLAPDMQTRELQPTLQDVALRDLALRGGERGA